MTSVIQKRYRYKHRSQNSLQRLQQQLSCLNNTKLPKIKIRERESSLNIRDSNQYETVTKEMSYMRKQMESLRKQVDSYILDKQIDNKISSHLMKMNYLSRPLLSLRTNALCQYHRYQSEATHNRNQLEQTFDNNIKRGRLKNNGKSSIEMVKKFRRVAIAVFFTVLFPAFSLKIKQTRINQFNKIVLEKEGSQYERKKQQIVQKLKKISLAQIFKSYNPKRGRVSAFMLLDSYKSFKHMDSISVSKFSQYQSMKKTNSSLQQIKSQSLALVLHFTQGLLGETYLKLGTHNLLNYEFFLLLNRKNGSPYFPSVASNQEIKLLKYNQKGNICIDEQSEKLLLSLLIFGLLINQVLAKIDSIQSLSEKQIAKLSDFDRETVDRFLEVTQISACFLTVILQEILQEQILRRRIAYNKIQLFKQLTKKKQVKMLMQSRPAISASKQQIKGFMILIIDQLHINLQRSYKNIRNQIKSKVAASHHIILEYNQSLINGKRRTILRKNTKQKSIKRNIQYGQRISKRSIEQNFGIFR